jgi:hypothetical protein
VSDPRAAFRVRYHRGDELRNDVTQQLARGGLLVRVEAPEGLTLHDPVSLSIVLPDGSEVCADTTVLQVLPGYGVAVATANTLVDEIRRKIAWQMNVRPDAGPAEHTRLEPAASRESSSRTVAESPAIEQRVDAFTHAEKIQMALHGSRDERNAILRDKNRALHPFVLKNPQLTIDDVSAMAKNAQLAPEMLRLIAERKEWLQRPAIALALAKNPKTPPEVAVRALDYVSQEALRTMAKGTGALPHVVQAARKKVLVP